MGRVSAICRATAISLLSSVSLANLAHAHGEAGDRFFPATIIIEDPAVQDEASLPMASIIRTGDNVGETDVSAEWSKRITGKLGVSVEETWTHLSGVASGFQNLETVLRYQFLTNAEHEVILSCGFGIEWANTGAKGAGAENFNVYTPQSSFGKGFGDLPKELALLRPFAITGQFGYAIAGSGKTKTVSFEAEGASVETEFNPDVLAWGLTLQYSLPYLNDHVRAIEGSQRELLSQLVPLIEVFFENPVSNVRGHQPTLGTVNPGVLWVGEQAQFGIEAIIPVNRDSGRSIGAIAQLHFYLDEIFPNSIGKPVF
jgi:hypothetical protein